MLGRKGWGAPSFGPGIFRSCQELGGRKRGFGLFSDLMQVDAPVETWVLSLEAKMSGCPKLDKLVFRPPWLCLAFANWPGFSDGAVREAATTATTTTHEFNRLSVRLYLRLTFEACTLFGESGTMCFRRPSLQMPSDVLPPPSD